MSGRIDSQSGSLTISGVSGKKIELHHILGGFSGTGPVTGTVQVKNGSTPIWEGGVSGAFRVGFVYSRPTGSTGADVTVTLTGGWLSVIYKLI